MFLMFARFSFKSADLAAEDKNYLEYHVGLARQLPGVRLYLTGKMAETQQGKPDHYRGVVFGYDTTEAGLNSPSSPVAVELAADSAKHIVGTQLNAFEGDVIVPFDSRKPGQPCCLAVVICNLRSGTDDPRYRAYRDSIRGLPGLCGYMAGKTVEARGEKPDRDWMEIRIFHTSDELRRASSSERAAIDGSLLEAPKLYWLEGEVQI